MNKIAIVLKDNNRMFPIKETELSKLQILKNLNNQNEFIWIDGIFVNKNNISYIGFSEDGGDNGTIK